MSSTLKAVISTQRNNSVSPHDLQVLSTSLNKNITAKGDSILKEDSSAKNLLSIQSFQDTLEMIKIYK